MLANGLMIVRTQRRKGACSPADQNFFLQNDISMSRYCIGMFKHAHVNRSPDGGTVESWQTLMGVSPSPTANRPIQYYCRSGRRMILKPS